MVSIYAALTVSLPALAEPLSDAERDRVITDYTQKQTTTQTFVADLRQTVQLRGMKRVVESIGQIYFQAPDRLALRFTKPAGEFLLIRGADVWVKKTDRPVIHRRQPPGQSDAGPGMLLSIFRSDAAEVRRMFAVIAARTNDELIVTMVPRDTNSVMRLQQVVNRVSWPALDVQAIDVTFPQSARMSFEFLNPRRNEPLDPAVFAEPRAEPLR